MKVFAELNDAGTRIEVHFKYDPNAVAAIKRVTGARFVKTPPKHWTIPADMDCARELRREFGDHLVLGDAVRQWGLEKVREQRQLASIKSADDATLANVPPEQADWLRPYQRADVALMAATNVLNANQPGVGKTVEAIYAIQEAGLHGPHLIVCPTSLFKDPWRDEIAKHVPGARVMWGSTPSERRGAINFTWMEQREGNASDIFLLLNPEMVRVERFDQDNPVPEGRQVLSRDHKGRAYCAKDDGAAEQLFEIKWGALITDEFHKFGLGQDRNTLFARGLGALRRNARRAFAMSGTPTGGKPIRLWGVLNFIEPEKYPSKWRWAGQWLLNAAGDGPVDPGAGTGIGDLRPELEDEFYAAHNGVMIRRTRKEALPGLPDKVIQEVLCEMTPKQNKSYVEMAAFGEAELDGGTVRTSALLAEFARLKQFANARCEVVDGDVVPTTDSGKLPVLLDRLDTFGIRAKDAEQGARAIVASESQRFVKLLESYLAEQGLAVRRLDGTVTGDARDAVIDWYKADVKEARTLVMTTQTGGVGLNLGMTGSIHVLDETWNPDDQEQLEDRGMRDRTTPLMVLYYRTRDSIQQYIAEIGEGKRLSNAQLLDLRKKVTS